MTEGMNGGLRRVEAVTIFVFNAVDRVGRWLVVRRIGVGRGRAQEGKELRPLEEVLVARLLVVNEGRLLLYCCCCCFFSVHWSLQW